MNAVTVTRTNMPAVQEAPTPHQISLARVCGSKATSDPLEALVQSCAFLGGIYGNLFQPSPHTPAAWLVVIEPATAAEIADAVVEWVRVSMEKYPPTAVDLAKIIAKARTLKAFEASAKTKEEEECVNAVLRIENLKATGNWDGVKGPARWNLESKAERGRAFLAARSGV